MINTTTDTNPSQGKILVACYIIAFNDALERARKLENMMITASPPPLYQLQLHKRPTYVESKLQLGPGLQQPLIWLGNDDEVNIAFLTRVNPN